MNLYVLLPVTAFLINGFVWTYIFAQKKQNNINKVFLLYSADLQLWLLVTILLRLPIPDPWLIPLLKFNSVFWLSICFWFLNFTYTFTNRSRDLAYYSFLSLTILSVIISISSNAIINGYIKTFWGVDEVPGPLMIIAIFAVIVVQGVYCLRMLINMIRNTDKANLKNSLKLLFNGTGLILVVGLSSNVVLPYFFKLYSFVQVAESFTIIQSIFIFRAVIKYRLFSIGVEDASHYLFEHMVDGVVIIDSSGNILLLNKSAKQIFSHDSFINRKKHISQFIPDYSRIRNDVEVEITIANNYSHRNYMATKTEISEDDTGLGEILFLRDITEQKKSIEVIKKSKQILTQAEQLAHLGSWEWDIANNKVSWSEELYRIYGLIPGQNAITFEDYISRIHPEDKDIVSGIILKALSDKNTVRFNERIIRPDGQVRYLFSKGVVNSDENGLPINMVGACLDITDFKKVENELRKSGEQLRALSASLQSAREEEKTHIAREIHDELGQMLTAVKMDINLLYDDLPEGSDLITKSLQGIESMINTLIQMVRNIATELRPEVLDHLGLASALEWQVNEFTKRTGTTCNLINEFNYIPLERDKSIAVFRILQEALTNITRHSCADKVDIFIANEINHLVMTIKDNGIGINDSAQDDIKSIGLIGMKERGIILGGEVEIKGEPGKGTTVQLKIPLPSDIEKESQIKQKV